jgi:hypothetical protein
MAALAAGLRAPFPRYWLSGFLADFGDGIRLAAFPLLCVQFTHSATAVAGVTAVQSLPGLALGAGLGVVVDRSDRRRLMAIVNIVQAAVIAGLAVAIAVHAAGLALIYGTAFVTGAGSVLRGTAAVTCVPILVEPDQLEQANGRVIAGQIVGSELAGPAAGGWLFGLVAVLPFALNAGALGVAVLLLLTLPSVFQPLPPQPLPRQHLPGSRQPDPVRVSPLAAVRRDVGEGLRWLRQHAEVRDLTIAVGVISAMDAAWFAVLVLCTWCRSCTSSRALTACCWPWPRPADPVAGTLAVRAGRRAGHAATQTVLGLTGNVFVAAMMLLASAAFALFRNKLK